MDRVKVEEANKIIEILDILNSYRHMEHDGNHFQFRQHYGSESNFIKIPRQYNGRFIAILDEIITEYEQRLEEL